MTEEQDRRDADVNEAIAAKDATRKAWTFSPTELRGAAVALGLGDVEAMLRVPDVRLAGNVVERARAAGKLVELDDAFTRLHATKDQREADQ